MKRRITSLSMAILLAVLFILGGCKRGQPTPMPTVAGLPTEDISVQREDIPDLGGREIKVAYTYALYNYDESSMSPSEATKQLEYEKVERIEKKYNCKITYLSAAESVDIRTQLWGSGYDEKGQPTEPPVDIYITHDGDLYGYRMINLGRYADELALDNSSLWNVQKNQKYQNGGQTKYLFVNNSYENYMHNELLFFNKTMLEEMGLWEEYNLYEMQKNKTWTWDAFAELCRKVQKKNSNKKGLYYGITVLDDFAISNRKGQMDAAVFQVDAQGQTVLNLEGETQKETLRFFKNLYNDGCLRMPSAVSKLKKNKIFDNPDFNVQTFHSDPSKPHVFFNDGNSREEALKHFRNGNDLFISLRGEYMYRFDDKFNGLDFEWGVVAHPMGPSSTDYVLADQYSPAYAIPYGVKNPEEIIPVLKELATPAESAETMAKVTVEQVSNRFDKDIAGTYALVSRPETMSIQLGAMRVREYYGCIFILYCGQYIMGDCSEVKLVKEVKPVAQQALRDTDVGIS